MEQTVKAITQETFDCVVQENVHDFEMDEAEAVTDAINQFQTQGVSLSMIIKEVPSKEGHTVLALVRKLKNEITNGATQDEISSILNKLSLLFKNDLANRYQASKLENAHGVLYDACQAFKSEPVPLKRTVSTFSSLLDGQPDLITKEGIQFALVMMEDSNDVELVALLLKILRFSCTKHEENRVKLVACNGISKVLTAAEKFKDSSSVIKEACGVLRCLTMDDDVRVPFGKAHEHTKMIVMEHSGLERLFKFIDANENDAAVTKELYATLGKLLVRSEFCQQMVELGGLEVIFKSLNSHMAQQSVVRQCITLLKAMSGNDDVKVAVVKAGGVELLLKALKVHLSNPQICESCFAALATIALRNPAHCDVIMANNAAVLMTQAMKEHSDYAGVQKQACMAIRNLVARTRHHGKVFIENGAENLIRNARTQHKAALDDQGKAALRDLDVDVELKERWQGSNTEIGS